MKGLFLPWVWRMALRDGRRGLRPLLLSMSCVMLAVASVVVAFSFRENVQSSIQAQSKSLLGADLSLDGLLRQRHLLVDFKRAGLNANCL